MLMLPDLRKRVINFIEFRQRETEYIINIEHIKLKKFLKYQFFHVTDFA